MWIASLSRWRSPPDSVLSGWPSRQVAEPDIREPHQDRVRSRDPASPVPKKSAASATGIASTSLMSLPPSLYSSTDGWNRLPSHSSHARRDARHHREVGVDDAGPLQFGQAPSEFALNSAGFTPFALAKALRIGSSSPV